MIKHGGNIYDYEKKMLDFSANINPFGMPDSVKNAIIENIDKYEVYPDIENRELVYKLSQKFRIGYDNIICGNGAADLIFRTVIALKPKKTLLIAPTFSEYEEALRLCGCEIEYYVLKESDGFCIKPDILNMLNDDFDILFVCNPNNPTGIPIKNEFIKKLYDKCSKHNIILAIDECFSDFLVNEDEVSMVTYLNSMPNIIIFKAFTKIYAMAGIRLGYMLCGNSLTARKIKSVLQPWSVSTVALKCGVAALDEVEYVEKTKKYITENRKFLTEELKKIGIKVYDSFVNYIFFKTEKEILKPLEKKGILIRSCANYSFLDKDYYRIAVRKENENRYFINTLKQILEVQDIG